MEVVEFAHGVSASITVPMHYNMFSINTGEVEEFRMIASAKKINFRILESSIPILITKGQRK